MRTGERRLAARAWVGAASSARARAHRAAAIVAYKLDFYDSVSATAMHSGCVIQSQSLLVLLASKSIDASLRKLQFCVFGCNSAQRSARAPARHRTDSHSCHGPAHLVSLRQSSASLAQRGASNQRAQKCPGGKASPSGPPSRASGPSRPNSPDKRSDIKQP